MSKKRKTLIINNWKQVVGENFYKKSFPKAKFIHRIDGPMRLYNDLSDPRDQQVYFANETFADATIYQSEWSKDKNLEMGLQPNALNATIQNCADDKIFFPKKN